MKKTVIFLTLLLLAGCDNCPVSVGDEVFRPSDGIRGRVAAVHSNGGYTQWCTVGVVWSDGETEATTAWRLHHHRGK